MVGWFNLSISVLVTVLETEFAGKKGIIVDYNLSDGFSIGQK